MTWALVRLAGFEADLLRRSPAAERAVAQARGALVLAGALVGALAAGLLAWRLTGSWFRGVVFSLWAGWTWLLLLRFTLAGYRTRCAGCGEPFGLHASATLLRLLVFGLIGGMGGATLAAALAGPSGPDGRLLLAAALRQALASPAELLLVVLPVALLALLPVMHLSTGALGTAEYERLRAERDGELVRRHDRRLRAALAWPLERTRGCAHEWRGGLPRDGARAEGAA